MNRAARLRLEADVAEAEEAFVAAKAKHGPKPCETCGRPEPGWRPNKQYQAAKDAVRDARSRLRAAREGSDSP